MKNETTSAAAVRETSPAMSGDGEIQLHFALADPAPRNRNRPLSRRRACSRERAEWWFDQMRRVVDDGRTVNVTGVF
jgi:hypothetical protein